MLEDYSKIQNYIAGKMKIALPSYEEITDSMQAINNFVSGKSPSLSGEVYTAKIGDTPTYNLSETHEDDLKMMVCACKSEIKNMAATGMAAAPFYFKRAAILAKKQKNYALEVKICELLITAYDIYMEAYKYHEIIPPLNIKAGSSYQEIVKRLPKAKANLKKQSEKLLSS